MSELIADIARATLPEYSIEQILVESSVDSMGEDSWHVTVTVGGEPPGHSVGESIVALENALRDRLTQAGDWRLPVVDLMTRKDLAEDVDTES